MAKSQPRILTEEYWRSFTLNDEELEHLHDLIVEEGIPQTTAFLVYEVVERRCRAEAEAFKEEIGCRLNIAIYDACYVALAESLGCPLVTADEPLVRRLAGEGLPVLYLGDLPTEQGEL